MYTDRILLTAFEYALFDIDSYQVNRRRGREGSYPPSPRTDPGVRNYRTGLFRQSRFRKPAFLSAIPCSEVGLALPALHVRTRFPVQAATACQPLPHNEYYGLIRPPKVFGFPTGCFGSAYLFRLLRRLYTWQADFLGTVRVSQACPEPAEGFLTLLSTHATL